MVKFDVDSLGGKVHKFLVSSQKGLDLPCYLVSPNTSVGNGHSIDGESFDPLTILIQGSSGVGGDIELWAQSALQCGHSIAFLDHFTPRQIEKLYYDFNDPPFTFFDLAEDVGELIKALETKVAWSQLNLVGFSIGATAAMLLNDSKFNKTFALYPTLRPLPESLLNIYTDNLKVFVGENDLWTPLKDIQYLAGQLSTKLEVVSFPKVYHSFCRPGCDNYIDSFPIGLVEELDGRVVTDHIYRKHFMTLDLWLDSEKVSQYKTKRVYLKYDEPAFCRVKDLFFER
jgi:dienelactone hydrolase